MPDTMPPRAVWQRIEQQAKAEGLFRQKNPIERYKWIAGPAIAATVAMLALNVQFGGAPVGPGPEVFSDIPDKMESSGLRDLKLESQTLERNLRLLPDNPSVRKVSTATTIRELEGRIAAIDSRLNDQSIVLDQQQAEIYWRERVRLMNILVRLRYAQAQRTAF